MVTSTDTTSTPMITPIIGQPHSTLSSSQTNLASLSTENTNSNKSCIDLEMSTQRSTSSSLRNDQSHKYWEDIFEIDLPEGKCIGLRISSHGISPDNPLSLDPQQIKSNDCHWIREMLHPDEVTFGMEMPSEPARLSFYMGRLAMRKALKLLKYKDLNANDTSLLLPMNQSNHTSVLPVVTSLDPSILKDKHGRPQVPIGFIGSISHKKTTGVALVNSMDEQDSDDSPPTVGIGVDIEQTFSRRRSIARKILTANELSNLGNLEGVTTEEEVLLRFSLKESVYKAMHPLISQRVSFQEAEITPHNDGTATIVLDLKSGAHKKFKMLKAHWRRIEGEDFFLTSARVSTRDEEDA